jgi:hypothetical protein
MDARTIQKACRRFGTSEGSLESSPVVRRTAEAATGERQYEVEVGAWVAVLVLDAGDIVITDIRRL